MEANEEKLHQSNTSDIPLRGEKLVDALSNFNNDQWEDFIEVNARWIRNLKKQWNLTEHFKIPEREEECNDNVAKLWAEFKEMRIKSPELRDHFLDLKSREAEGKKDPESKTKVKKFTSIKSNEKKRQGFQRVKVASGKARSKGL